MNAHRVVVSVLLAAAFAFGQSHKPVIDPETKEGYVLQLIKQERDPAQKTKMMKDFAVEFPTSPSLSWVYDQLQPVHLAAKEYDQVVALGAKMLELDADDIYGAHTALEAAEALKDPELVQKFGVATWQIGSRLAGNPKSTHKEYARLAVAYAEYSIATVANEEKDFAKRQSYMKVLENLNPKSVWLSTSKGEFFTLAQQGVSKDKLVALAHKILAIDPANEDMLMLVADYHMEKNDAPNVVVDFSTRAVDVLEKKPLPEGMTQEEWDKKKEKYLGAAHYMIGVISSLQGRFSQADRNLRAALPTIKATSPQVLGAVLYHLGYANYQLAEKGERPRVFDAIKFNEQCAGVPSSYREQAQKNVESIKSEYNLR